MSSKKSAKKTPQSKTKQTSQFDTGKIAYLILGLLCIVLYYYCKRFDFIQDDSFITFRFVKNFTEGNGLVFNIGERVEGYTCFLWVMILALIKTLGFNFISASQTLGILSSVLTLVFTYLISSKIFPKDKSPFYNITFCLIAVMLLASNGSFVYWSVSGMETGLFGFLVTLAIYLYLKENKSVGTAIPYSSIAFLLASMTRPEGNLIFAITVLHKIIITLKANTPEGTSKTQLLFSKTNLMWIGIYIIPALIFMGWRYSYYGYLFPNTFYAKTGSSFEYFSAGRDYFIGFAKAYGGYGVLIVLTLLVFKSKTGFYNYLYLIMIFFIFSIYVIFIGGDVLRPNRFFVPILPVFFILVQEGLSVLVAMLMSNNKKAPAYGALLGIAFAAAFSYYTYKNEYETIKKYSELENGLVDKMRISGTWMKKQQTLAGRPLVVAASTIGAVSYYSDVILIDMLGLTDKEIAHHPMPIPEISSKDVGWRERNYNVDYVISRKPDYIYFSTDIKPSAYAERGLFTSDEFMKYYYPYYFEVKEYDTFEAIYKRKTDEDANNRPQFPPNPNYKKTFVNTYNQAMNTSRDKAKRNEAITLYEQAISEGPPGWGTPYYLIGDLYSQAKDKNKTFEYYKKSVETDDYNVLAHYYLFAIYMEKGDTVNADISIEKVKKYDPELLQ